MPPPSSPALLFRNAAAARPPIPLNRVVTLIGSKPQCQVRLVSRDVSGCHALVLFSGGRLYVRDLNSRTGVCHNGTKVREAYPVGGDLVGVGPFEFEIAFPAGAAAADHHRPRVGRHPTPADLRLESNAAVPPIRLSGPVFLIGRRRGADLRIADPRISIAHAAVVDTGDGWTLLDLGSRQGTELNGSPVREARLESGDRIRVAETTLRFETPQREGALPIVPVPTVASPPAPPPVGVNDDPAPDAPEAPAIPFEWGTMVEGVGFELSAGDADQPVGHGSETVPPPPPAPPPAPQVRFEAMTTPAETAPAMILQPQPSVAPAPSPAAAPSSLSSSAAGPLAPARAKSGPPTVRSEPPAPNFAADRAPRSGGTPANSPRRPASRVPSQSIPPAPARTPPAPPTPPDPPRAGPDLAEGGSPPLEPLVDLLDARVLAFASPAADEPPVARAVRAPHAARGPRRLTMLIVLTGVLLCGLVAAAAWAYQSGLLRPRS